MEFAQELQIFGIKLRFVKALALARACDVVPVSARLDAIKFQVNHVRALSASVSQLATQKGTARS
jgi:hypothetical protein